MKPLIADIGDYFWGTNPDRLHLRCDLYKIVEIRIKEDAITYFMEVQNPSEEDFYTDVDRNKRVKLWEVNDDNFRDCMFETHKEAMLLWVKLMRDKPAGILFPEKLDAREKEIMESEDTFDETMKRMNADNIPKDQIIRVLCS